MTRRQALGLLMAALLLGGGRGIRHYLLVGPTGAWRDPGWLDRYLPALPEPARPSSRPVRPTAPVAINICPAESLLALPGVGPTLAGRIVDSRLAEGPYTGLEDLQRIKGIGPRLAARLAPWLTFSAFPGDSVPLLKTNGHSASVDTCAMHFR